MEAWSCSLPTSMAAAVGSSTGKKGVVIVLPLHSVRARCPAMDLKEQIFPAGSPKAHQSIRVSMAGTNLSNELPLRAHQSFVRSYCADARTNATLPGSWHRCASDLGGWGSP